MELEKLPVGQTAESSGHTVELTCALSDAEPLKGLKEEVDRASLVGPWRRVWETWDRKVS